METLGDAFPKEVERVRTLVQDYESIGPSGAFALMHIRPVLEAAEKALATGDTVAMIRLYPILREKE